MISMETKAFIISLYTEAVSNGCRRRVACEDLGISIRTIQRWIVCETLEDQRPHAKRQPVNRLSSAEEAEILKTINSFEFKDKTPWEIIPALADRGIYLASESTFYRLMRQLNQLTHRSKSRPKTHVRPKAHTARGPNEVWTWDITYLRSRIRGQFFYLYMILDIFSRKIVGWRIHETQSDDFASALIEETCFMEGILPSDLLVLHSDNGSAMKGSTMLSTLHRLGVVPSFSRPHVSDDNPYSESLFKTLKYVPYYPSKPFETCHSASEWVAWFVTWYNTERFHGEIQYVTPDVRHRGLDTDILSHRKAVYERARSRHPERWKGSTRNWSWIQEVCLNPRKETKPSENRTSNEL